MHDAGFALITALWVALILALIVSFVVKAGRTDARIVHTARRQAELHALARGAITIMELRLLAPSGAKAIPMDGTPVSLDYVGHWIQVRIQDQAGLIDLNFASGDMLRRLFRAVGEQQMDAQAFSDRILDWREKGAGRRLNGAKARDYADAGYEYGPREGPFETVPELRLILGMKTDLFDRIEPALTVFSQKPVVEPRLAPLLVLKSLPEESSNDVESILRQRERSKPPEETVAPTFGVGRSVEITVNLEREVGVTADLSCFVRITGYTETPLWNYGCTQ